MKKNFLTRVNSRKNILSHEFVEEKKIKSIGVHVIAELMGCGFDTLNDAKMIKEAMLNASAAAKFTILDILIKKFTPQGVTAVLLLSESHFSVHTWPELDYAAVDMFTCSKTCSPNEALMTLINYLKPKKFTTKEMIRGPSDV